MLMTPCEAYQANGREDILKDYASDLNLSLEYGVYPITDRSLPMKLMQDRAALAAKNRTDPMFSEVGFYTDQQRQRIIREQQVLDEIEGAMDRGEIIIYIQAKYDIVAQRVIGGEALVRWQHPVRGLLGPGQFVGVLEENGLIMQLDYYVWEKTCQFLQRQHRLHEQVPPVSVNVSKYNFYRANLVALFTDGNYGNRLCGGHRANLRGDPAAPAGRLYRADGRFRRRLFLAEHVQGCAGGYHQAGHGLYQFG